jgi:hypothetical protein
MKDRIKHAVKQGLKKVGLELRRIAPETHRPERPLPSDFADALALTEGFISLEEAFLLRELAREVRFGCSCGSRLLPRTIDGGARNGSARGRWYARVCDRSP